MPLLSALLLHGKLYLSQLYNLSSVGIMIIKLCRITDLVPSSCRKSNRPQTTGPNRLHRRLERNPAALVCHTVNFNIVTSHSIMRYYIIIIWHVIIIIILSCIISYTRLNC